MIRTKILSLLGAALLMVACAGSSDDEKADKLLGDAKHQVESGDYAEALVTIDSLRKAYPHSLEARKQALALYQQASLKMAQQDLAHTDSLIAILSTEYDSLKAKVDQDRAVLNATVEETQRLNLTKARLDSLKVRFDMQCAKIKYIHKKQKE